LVQALENGERLMVTLESIKKKMWDNYYKQEKLIKQRTKLKYGDPKAHKLTEQINNLISKRKILDRQWNKLSKAEKNKELKKFGIIEGDRVHVFSTGLFTSIANIVKGTVVMYRGRLTVKLDDPDEFRRKYVPLTKYWRKEP
jgi:hypothetical protein